MDGKSALKYYLTAKKFFNDKITARFYCYCPYLCQHIWVGYIILKIVKAQPESD